MQFLLKALDAQDPDVLNRRLAARADYVQIVDALRDQGKVRFGAAILNSEERMIGSIMVFDVASRDELDLILTNEPYVKNKVWGEIEIQPCKVGPSFERG